MTSRAKFNRADWSIAIRVAPIVAVVLVAKVAINALEWDTVQLNPLHTGLVAGNIFLIGFLLSGTLTDYKESERLPGELAGRVETIADECQILFRDTGAAVARDCLEHVNRLAEGLHAWLGRGASVEDPLDRIEGFNHYFLAFQPLTQPNFIVRLKQEQAILRLLVIRINTIKETSFVGAGYVMAGITSLLLVIALLFAHIATLGAELFLIGAITFLVSYLVLLTRDLDNPFDYDEHRKQGSAEVSLVPLQHLERRMARELQELTEER